MIRRVTKRSIPYLSGLLAIQPTDVWLASFPKAGNTWMRFIICNLILQMEGRAEIASFERVGQLMPSLGISNLFKRQTYSLPRFIKTHRRFSRFIFPHSNRVLYIARDPRDCMVSYYNWSRSLLKNPYQDEFTDFLRDKRFGLAAAMRHYQSWQPHITHCIHYERLLQSPVEEMRSCLQAFSIQVSEELLVAALDRASFDSMSRIEKRDQPRFLNNFQSDFRFVREGRANQWQAHFSAADNAYYSALCESFGYNLYPASAVDVTT